MDLEEDYGKSLVLNAIKLLMFPSNQIHREVVKFTVRAVGAKNEMKIIGGVTDERERNLDQRIKETTSLGEIIGAQVVFISHGERNQDERNSLINHKVLKKMKCPKELLTHL